MSGRDPETIPVWWDADFMALGIAAPVFDGPGAVLSEPEYVRLVRELERLGRRDLMGVLDVARGDGSLALGRYAEATDAYERAMEGLRESPRATEFLRAVVGLAELKALAGRWESFTSIIGNVADRVEGEEAPAVQARARGILHVKAALLGHERDAGEWQAMLSLLEASGDNDGPWRMSHALAKALEKSEAFPEAAELFGSSQEIAKTAGRDILFSESALCHAQMLFRSGRRPECDDLVLQALEASRRVDDIDGMDRALALGCDVAVALGQPNLLLQRSLERSHLAQKRGQGELSRKLVRQALLVAVRTGSAQTLEIGGRLAELCAPDRGLDPGAVEVAEMIDDIVAADLLEEARDLALAWARHRFGSGWKREAAALLVKACEFTFRMGDLSLAREMHSEALSIAEMYGLDELEQWRRRGQKLFE